MSTLIEDRMAEMHRLNDSDDPIPDAALTTVAPEPAAVTAPVPVARVLSYDDLLPDDDSVPQSLRNKPMRELLEDRKRAIFERDNLGAAKNEAEVLRNLVTLMMEKQTAPAPVAAAEPARAETIEDQIRRENIDAIMSADPALALGRAAEITRDSSLTAVKGQLDPINQRLDRIEQAENVKRVQAAHQQAGRILKRDPAEWVSSAETEAISGVMLMLQLPQDDPQSYVKASSYLDGLAAARTPKVAAVVPPPAPTAPPPPVGSGAAAAPADTQKPQLDVRTSNVVDRIRKNYAKIGITLPEDKLNEAALLAMDNRKQQSAR